MCHKQVYSAVFLTMFLSLILSSSSTEVYAQVQVANQFQFPLDTARYTIKENTYDFLDDSSGVFHPGEDWNIIINTPEKGCDTDLGDPVFAIANGEVVTAQNFGGSFGNIVLIRHTLPDGSNIWSQYAHLERIDVTTGAVSLGKQIGTIGKGGWPCAHLHFEIRISYLPANHWPNINDWNFVYNNYVKPSTFLVASDLASGGILFEDSFFRGNSFQLQSATSANVPAFLNDRTSSIALSKCWSARVYKDANQSGSSKTISVSDLYLSETYNDGSQVNDSISSISTFVNPCPGDANYDGRVDGIDYMIWRNNYLRASVYGPSYGDFNSDGRVDGIDYMIWRNNYGN